MAEAGLAGQVGIVTGGSRGIGRGIAETLGSAGMSLVVNYNANAAAADEVVAAVRAAGAEALAVQADVANLEHHERLVAAALERFGRLDLLVNNAGVAPEKRLDILEASPESYDRVMTINLRGPYFLTQRAARAMIELVRGGTVTAPKIVNITSISAYTASIARGDYCLSKAGLAMMTMLYADRLAEFGIGVFEIRPGVIATDMTGPVREKYDALIAGGLTPIARWGRPEDIGAAVLAIAEDRFPFSTGQVINVDGGFHLRRL